jgi:hypothetical protein
MKTTKELKADYQTFIDGIPDYLETAERLLGLDEITFSYEEIDSFRSFYASNFDKAEKHGLTRDELGTVFCAYVGEAFIHHCRGNWEISKLKSDEACGTPIILNWGFTGKPRARISPTIWRTLIEKGKFKETLSSVIEKAKTRQN